MILLDAIFILILSITVYKTDETIPIIETLMVLLERYLYVLCAALVSVGGIVIFRGINYSDDIETILSVPIFYLVIVGCSIPMFWVYKRYVAKNKLYYLGSRMLANIFWGILIAVHLLTAVANLLFTK